MKKALKIIGVVFALLIVFLLASPFIFQNKIKNLVKQFANENLNAKIDFKDASLSFISSFPKANVTLDELTITNFAPFEGNQLVNVKTISFDFNINELFKNTTDEPIEVKEIYINEAILTLKSNKNGLVNWDIAKPKAATINEENSDQNFIFKLDNYEIENSVFTYIDDASEVAFYITDLNHSGNGTFSQAISDLTTTSKAKISLKVGETEYLSENTIDLDAVIQLDLENSKYTFKDNKAVVNQLPIEISGYFQQLEDSQKMDLSFKNTGSTFKDFLAVLPKAYSKDLKDVSTTGNFDLNGRVFGELTETTIPKLDINVVSNNASFKYNSLPKAVTNIVIDAHVKNNTGNPDDTYVDLNTLNFQIDKDLFKSSAKISQLTKNILVSANLDGVLNLANLSKAYPIDLDNELTGVLQAKLNTNFDMDAISNNKYQRIKNNGSLTITGFNYSSKDIVNPINISKANVRFQPGLVTLNEFNATSGKSDINATGSLDNILGYLLSDKKLKGNFNVNSNVFAVNDFMVEGEAASEESKASKGEALKIPAFLDATINANAKKVYYDNLVLNDVKGQLVIKDEQAQLNNMTSSIFDGNLSMNGLVNTKSAKPTFNMNLNASQFNIAQSFKDLELLQSLAPLAKLLQGKLNSTIALSGNLGEDFAPDLASLTGGATANLLTTQFQPKNEKVLSLLENKLSFLDFSKLDLKDLSTKIAFNNGKVAFQPFDLKYKDIDIEIGGSHNLNNVMDYTAVLKVPAKYLGSDINRLIGKINDPEVNTISIPVTANITGSFSNPDVKTDLSSGVKSLTAQLIEIEKQKLIGKGKDKIKDLLGNVGSGNNSTSQDSTKTSTGDAIKDVLGGIIKGNNNTPKDTAKTKNDPVKNVLGNIFGKKKKKDSVN